MQNADAQPEIIERFNKISPIALCYQISNQVDQVLMEVYQSMPLMVAQNTEECMIAALNT